MKYQSVAICFLLVVLMCTIAVGKEVNDDNFLPGYVVTNNMDTLRGLIRVEDHFSNSLACVFKESTNASTQKFTPSDLISYGVDGLKYFLSEKITIDSVATSIFAECVLKGKLSLYHFQGQYFIKTTTNFKELSIDQKEINRQGKMYKVKIDLFKAVLEEEMKDCTTISSHIKTTTLTGKSLHKLFIQYYNCQQEAYSNFETNQKYIKVSVGISMGVVSSYMKFSTDGNNFAQYLDSGWTLNTLSFMPSFSLELSNVSGNNKFRFATGLYFTSNEYNSEEIYSYTGNPAVSINNTRIELPLLIKYNLLKSNKGPYLTGGFGINSFLKWEDKITNNTNSIAYSTWFTSMIVGAGYRFPLNKKFCQIDCTFNRSSVLDWPTTYAKNLALSIGIFF